MERHERYDPEDIEGLLLERGFDELLPDERAFVLRHISGREEYERMRALLRVVRHDERDRGGIRPDERVKPHVLAVFRAHRTPVWRIHLNTLYAWVVPRAASSVWRPALAFATLAVIIVAGFLVVDRFKDPLQGTEMAEITRQETAPGERGPGAAGRKQHNIAPQVTEEVVARGAWEPAPPSSKSTGIPEALDLAAMRNDTAGEKEWSRTAQVSGDQAFLAETLVKQEAAPPAAPDLPADHIVHVVTKDELATNMSTTNLAGTVKGSAMGGRSYAPQKEAERTTGRSVVLDPALLELVTAGW